MRGPFRGALRASGAGAASSAPVSQAAFFKRSLGSLEYVPRVIVTDRLGSYGAAKREVLPDVEHR